MGELRSDTVKQALEEVKVRDVETWTKETFGITFHQEKSAGTNSKFPENPQEIAHAV